ncbi:MAG: hypothetical protein K8F91_16865, partial [Candidatus Obscuribacterales bacterium]|nr:hypothetical protein [Candidatus Obscuribacterales bacterium]
MLSLFLALIVFSHGELPGFSSSSSYWRHLNDLRYSWNPSAPPSKIVWQIYLDKAQELVDNNDSLAAVGLLESALEHVRHLPDTEERRTKTVEMLAKHSKESDLNIEAGQLVAFLKIKNFKNDNLHALEVLQPGSSRKSASVSVEAKIREADFLVEEGDYSKSERLYQSA